MTKPPAKLIFGLSSLLAIYIAAIITLILLTRPSTATLRVNQKSYHLSLAQTTKQVVAGLSDRPSLPANQGMLFKFITPAKYCFWMKGMRFPVDIIWLDQAKQVINLKSNLSPSTYPISFCPNRPASYVIELKSGTVQSDHIKTSQTLNF